MTRYALKNKGVVIFFFFIILLLGLRSIQTIPKQEFPEFPVWNAVVVTQFPGASSLKVEELITEKVEAKMREVGELKEITSVSQTGVSYIFLSVKEQYEIVKPIWDKVREKLDDLQGQMPQGATQPFLNSDFGKTKAFVLAVTGDGFNNRELVDVADDLKKDISLLKYVARVDLVGEQEERIFLEFSNTRLSELGISVDYIAQILVQQNVLSQGGEIKVGSQSIRIEATGEFKTVEEIGKTVIAVPGNTNLFFLQDLASIQRKYIEPPVFEMRFMGQDAVGLVVEMVDGGQILELGQSIEDLLAQRQTEVFWGIEFHVVNFQPTWVVSKINEFLQNLWQAVAIVVIFMVVLLGWREGLIIGMLIPFSFLITLTALEMIGTPIHQISLVSMIIALGMLVDNGIVMTESISGYIKAGMSKTDAAIRSAKELTVPLITSTCTTVAAFLPIALAESGVGIYCRAIPYGVGIVLASSFFVAMTLVPMLCVSFLKEKKPSEVSNQISLFGRVYTKFMTVAIRFRFVTIAVVVLVFFGVMQLGGYIQSIFFPPSDRTQFLVDFYLPEGTDYRVTKAQALEAEAYILSKFKDDVKNVALYIGEGGPRFQFAASGEQQSPNYAQFMVNSTSHEATEAMIADLKRYFPENFEDVFAIVRKLENGPPVGAPVQVRIAGKEIDDLYSYAQQVTEILENTPGTRDIRDDWGERIPKLSIEVNQEQARRIGVSSASIAQTLRRVVRGDSVTEYREGDSVIPIYGRSIEEDRTTLGRLQDINLPTSQGTTVPLTQVANLKLEWEAGKIRHRDRRRTITVSAYVKDGYTAKDITDVIQSQIAQIEFQSGDRVTYGGVAEGSSEAEESINVQVPIAMTILVLILVAQFGNVRKMLLILMTIPLSFMGIILGLLTADYAFGFMAFLGVISLAGIVVNNAILLIEQIDADLALGKSQMEAVISAGRRRAFPIILTTLTTLSGLFPLAISGDFWGPMAVTIMGGLLVSTMLTLVVIPTLYAIFFRVKYEKVEIEPKAVTP